MFLFVKLRLFLLLWTSSILIATNFNCAYCIELNFLFTSLYPVSRVYTSRLWTLQLCMPLLILILWLCLPNILKESSPNFLIFCINLFTTLQLTILLKIVRRNELFVSTVNASDLVKLSWKNFLHLLWTTLKSCNHSRIELSIYIYIFLQHLVDSQSIKYCRIYQWLCRLTNSTLFSAPSVCIL